MVAVREVDVRADQKDLVDLLSRHFENWGARAEAKFEWLYLTNPFGQARAWALGSGSDRFVGVSAAFPRRLRAGARTINAWVLGNFCVDANYRSLGPALQLQRAVSSMVDRGAIDTWYDFPSRTMQAIYGRMGVSSAGQLFRFVHPLRVDGMVSQEIDNSLLAGGLKAVGNAVLGARDALRGRDASIEVRLFEDHFEGDSKPGYAASRTESFSTERPNIFNGAIAGNPAGGAPYYPPGATEFAEAFSFSARTPENHAILDAFAIREEVFLRDSSWRWSRVLVRAPPRASPLVFPAGTHGPTRSKL